MPDVGSCQPQHPTLNWRRGLASGSRSVHARSHFTAVFSILRGQYSIAITLQSEAVEMKEIGLITTLGPTMFYRGEGVEMASIERNFMRNSPT
jgi:hypothetical protein